MPVRFNAMERAALDLFKQHQAGIYYEPPHPEGTEPALMIRYPADNTDLANDLRRAAELLILKEVEVRKGEILDILIDDFDHSHRPRYKLYVSPACEGEITISTNHKPYDQQLNPFMTFLADNGVNFPGSEKFLSRNRAGGS